MAIRFADVPQVTLFTRGKAPITQQLPGESDTDYADFSSKILHLKGDRKDFEFVKSNLAAEGFDVVYDINGREAVEVESIIDALPNLEQYIYCSSAGVYLKSDYLPNFETHAVDPKSRHKGKLETESLLEARGINWTSITPVYTFGPLNYNPVEERFFHRLKAGRPIPVPNSGMQVTQLGHVKVLAAAFMKVLDNEKASKQVFNISGKKNVTFDGLAKHVQRLLDSLSLAKEFDFGKKKAYPFRDVTSISLLPLKKQKVCLDGNQSLTWRRVFQTLTTWILEGESLGKKLISPQMT